MVERLKNVIMFKFRLSKQFTKIVQRNESEDTLNLSSNFKAFTSRTWVFQSGSQVCLLLQHGEFSLKEYFFVKRDPFR